jgi:hypothetical protein
MPLITPLVTATLRRHWPIIGALALLLPLTIVHQFWFRGAAERYRTTLKQANELGMAFDPAVAPAILPPRLFALVMDNSLPAEEAMAGSNSGTLTAQLLEDVTRMAGMRNIQVLVTEPGPVSQLDHSIQIRAHLRVRCRYDQFVGLLEDMSSSGKLLAVDRFTFSSSALGGESLDLWVSRLILKRDKARR